MWAIETDHLSERYSYLLDSAIRCVNAALQVMQAAGEDYFTRSTLTVALSPGVAEYALPDSVQCMSGPCRFQGDRHVLRRLMSRGELDGYGPLFLGKLGNALAPSRPQAYWIEQLHQAGADAARVVLHVVPAPAAGENVLIDVQLEAPGYSRADYCGDVVVPVPHQYVESILLPIARYEATRSYHALQNPAQGAVLPQLKEFHDRALAILGLVRPSMDAGSGGSGGSGGARALGASYAGGAGAGVAGSSTATGGYNQ